MEVIVSSTGEKEGEEGDERGGGGGEERQSKEGGRRSVRTYTAAMDYLRVTRQPSG